MRADVRLTPGLLALLIGCIVGLLGGGLATLRVQGAPPWGGAAAATPAADPEPLDARAASGPGAAPVATPTPETTPTCAPAPLAARAAAVLVVGLPGVLEADAPLAEEVVGLGVGGILLTKANVSTSVQVRALVADLRARADGPLLVTTDEEPGRVSSFGAVLGRSSSARTLAARETVADVHARARAMGEALRGHGVDVALAPVADLDDGPSGGVIGDRSFSVDPDVASAYVAAHAAGLVRGGVLPTVKHFPGHGRSRVDSHRELAVVEAPLGELRRTDLRPFVDQIRAGAPAVMLAHVAFDALDGALPASLDPQAYALLRDLGFEGVAMTDSLGMGAVNLRWGFGEAAVLALAAGADAILATDGGQARAMRDAIVAAVRDGDLDEARLDEAVARVRQLTRADPADLVCVDVPFPPLPGPMPRL